MKYEWSDRDARINKRCYDVLQIILSNNQSCDVQNKLIQLVCVEDLLIKFDIELITVEILN